MCESELSQGFHQSLRIPRLPAMVPAYNEEDILDQSSSEAVSALGHVTHEWELVVVDDGSTDRTPEVLAEWSARQPRLRRSLES